MVGQDPGTNVCLVYLVPTTGSFTYASIFFSFLGYVGHRCDAEPGALADYILALLKHNAPEHEMRQELAVQLDEFLEKGSSILSPARLLFCLYSVLHLRVSWIHRHTIYGPKNKVVRALRCQLRFTSIASDAAR